MSNKTIQIFNSTEFFNLKQFLISVRKYYDVNDNPDKKERANMYIDDIISQRPLESGKFELEVPGEISEFAKEVMGAEFDDFVWQKLNADTKRRAEIEKGYDMLSNL